MEKYIYKCFDCGKEYSRKFIENNFRYLCPGCGLIEKNMPLRGVLTIRYNYSEIRKKQTREEFFNHEPGKFWLYDYLWPLQSVNGKIKGVKETDISLLALNSNPVCELQGRLGKFLVLDDTRNPSLSYKDRATSLVVLKALQLGIDKIAAASTGNAGSSLACLSARLGLKSVLFVPKTIPAAKLIQIQSYGAEVIMVNGDYDLAFDTCLETAGRNSWYNRNTAYNPLTIEGKKSAAYDIFISTRGRMPDVILVPVGDGVIISGIYKGLSELKELGWIKKIPRLIAVQAAGSNALYRFFSKRTYKYKPASSAADSICAGAPRNLLMAFDSVIKSGGTVLTVTDKEILSAQKTIAMEFGILAEPSSSASYAGYVKYMNNNSKRETPLLLLTGNGLKDTASLSKWNKPLKIQNKK